MYVVRKCWQFTEGFFGVLENDMAERRGMTRSTGPQVGIKHRPLQGLSLCGAHSLASELEAASGSRFLTVYDTYIYDDRFCNDRTDTYAFTTKCVPGYALLQQYPNPLLVIGNMQLGDVSTHVVQHWAARWCGG